MQIPCNLEERDGIVYVTFPSFPNMFTDGTTISEALHNAADVVEAMLLNVPGTHKVTIGSPYQVGDLVMVRYHSAHEKETYPQTWVPDMDTFEGNLASIYYISDEPHVYALECGNKRFFFDKQSLEPALVQMKGTE